MGSEMCIRDRLYAVLAKFGVPPHLVQVIRGVLSKTPAQKRDTFILLLTCFSMNTDLAVTFDLNGEPVKVPCTVGVKQGCPLSPTLFLFVIQACLESLDKDMPKDAKLHFRTTTRTSGARGGRVPGTNYQNKGECLSWASGPRFTLTTQPHHSTRERPSSALPT